MEKLENIEPSIEGEWITLEGRINNPAGIHARPSAMIAKKTFLYPGEICIERLENPERNEEAKEKVSCKEVTELIIQELNQDSRFKIYVEIYPDKLPKEKQIQKAKSFCRDLYKLISSDFEEAYQKL